MSRGTLWTLEPGTALTERGFDWPVLPEGAMDNSTLDALREALGVDADELVCDYPQVCDFCEENEIENRSTACDILNGIVKKAGGECIRLGEDILAIRMSKDAKLNWFKKAWEDLKDRVSKLSLEVFANSPDEAYRIQSLIDDSYEDATVDSMGSHFSSFDNSMRELHPDAWYILYPGIYMH